MQHLLLDLYGCNAEKLANADELRYFLSEVPDLIHMQRVSPVYLEHITEVSDPKDAGHSGFVIIASSHVSLHAWPPYGMVNIDLFSCELFDEAEVVAFARMRFGAVDSEVRTIQRAVRSPRPSASTAHALIERQQQPVQPLDQCLREGCQNHTGSVAIAYCNEHRGTRPQSPPLSHLASS